MPNCLSRVAPETELHSWHSIILVPKQKELKEEICEHTVDNQDMQTSIKWKLQRKPGCKRDLTKKTPVLNLNNVVVFNLRYLSQKLSVCSCIKWPVHQMLSTQVLRRVVYSAERLADCPLPKIIRIIGIKPVLSCMEWMENKSMYVWLCQSLEHRNGSNKCFKTHTNISKDLFFLMYC